MMPLWAQVLIGAAVVAAAIVDEARELLRQARAEMSGAD